MPSPSRRVANKDIYAVIPFFMAEIGLMLIMTIIVSYGWPAKDGSIGLASLMPYYHQSDGDVLRDTLRVPGKRILHLYLDGHSLIWVDGHIADLFQMEEQMLLHLKSARQSGQSHYLLLKTDRQAKYATYIQARDAYLRVLNASGRSVLGARVSLPLIEWEEGAYYGPPYRWVR